MPQNRRLRLMNVWMHACTLTMYVWMYACPWCAWCMQGLCICGVIFLSLSTLNRNPYANPYVWSGQSHIAIFLSILCCKILVQQVSQLRLDRSIPREACQWDSLATGKPPLEYFRQSSIAMLRSILNCNTCWTRVLQQRIDKSIATLLWPLLTGLHIYPHYCFTVHVVHCICNLQTNTASILQKRVWRLGTQESGLMRCACVELLDDC